MIYSHELLTPIMKRRNTNVCQLGANGVQKVKRRTAANPDMVAFFLPMRSAIIVDKQFNVQITKIKELHLNKLMTLYKKLCLRPNE